MKSISLVVYMGVLFFLAACAELDSVGTVDQMTVTVPRAEISSIGFVTRDMEATIAFYTNVLGLTVVGTAGVTAEKTLQVIGARSAGAITYTALAPQTWVDGNKALALVSFFEVPTASDGGLTQNANRQSVSGEVILAHRVDNVDVVARRAHESGVSILAPLGDSGTSRTSRSIALLDPNGIRIEVYEY